MTLDEAANAAADREFSSKRQVTYGPVSYGTLRDLVVRAFRAGAQWQQQKDDDAEVLYRNDPGSRRPGRRTMVPKEKIIVVASPARAARAPRRYL